MPRPAPVTAAIVTFSIFLFIVLMSYFAAPQAGRTFGFWIASVLALALHGFPIYGLVRQRPWARVLALSVASLYSTLFFGVSAYLAFTTRTFIQASPSLVGASLLAWLAYSLFRSPAVRSYLASPVAPVSTSSPAVPSTPGGPA